MAGAFALPSVQAAACLPMVPAARPLSLPLWPRTLAVGMVAAHCAFVRGANRVVLIDQQQDRLDFAATRIPHLETINVKGETMWARAGEGCGAARGGGGGMSQCAQCAATWL